MGDIINRIKESVNEIEISEEEGERISNDKLKYNGKIYRILRYNLETKKDVCVEEEDLWKV